MSRRRRGKKAGEDAERLLQEAFGVSEDQLLKDFILAQTEVKDSDIPPESEDGFERLMAKLEAEVGLILWNCLDVYPADGYDRDLCVHLR